MSELIQTLADGLFSVLFVLETFLTVLDNIPFIDSGYTLLELFYAFTLIGFFINLFKIVITPDDDQQEAKVTDEIDSNLPLGI